MHNSLVEDVMLIENRARDIEIEEIKKSLEFAHHLIRTQKSEIDNLRMEHRSANLQIKKMDEELKKYQKLVDDDHNRLVYLDDYGRRSSLRFRGIDEEAWETWEQCQAKVLRLLQEKLNLKPEIERAHRLGKRHPHRHREIIVKFLRYPDKEFILNNRHRLSSSGIVVKEDFCEDTAALRASFHDEIKEAREEGLIAYAKYRTLVKHPPREHNGARRGGRGGRRGSTSRGARGGTRGSRGNRGGNGGSRGARGGLVGCTRWNREWF